MLSPFDTPERIEFRKVLKTFVANEITPNCDKWDEEGKIPWELHQKAGKLGIWGFGIDLLDRIEGYTSGKSRDP